jgi:hypothetical protein
LAILTLDVTFRDKNTGLQDKRQFYPSKTRRKQCLQHLPQVLRVHAAQVNQGPREGGQVPEPGPHVPRAIRQVGLFREPDPDVEPQPGGGDAPGAAEHERKAARPLRLRTHAGGKEVFTRYNKIVSRDVARQATHR